MPALKSETITTIAEMQEYARTMVAKAKHHAAPLRDIITPCLGALMLRVDSGSIDVRRGKDGLTPRLHFTVKGMEYVATHDHQDILIRLGSQVGPIIARVTEKMTLRQINTAFEVL